MSQSILSLCALSSTLLLTTAAAQAQPARSAGPPLGTSFSIEGAYLHQFETDIDDGGNFSVNRLFLQGGAIHTLANGFSGGLSVGGGQDSYDFSGSSGFGGSDPWSDIRNLRISVPLRYNPAGNWSYVLIPSLRYSFEEGASLSDSQTYGALAAASYRVSDTLTIGPGIGVFSQLEDSASVFPILAIDWKITPSLTLETGRGLAATQGPGLQLRWKANNGWSITGGGRYEKSRFRLDNNGPARKGIGEDKAIPLYLSASYAPNPGISFSGLIGADVGGSLRLEDEDSNRLSKSDFDTAPFAALTLKARF